mgnify:CR=1 FL=1
MDKMRIYWGMAAEEAVLVELLLRDLTARVPRQPMQAKEALRELWDRLQRQARQERFRAAAGEAEATRKPAGQARPGK